MMASSRLNILKRRNKHNMTVSSQVQSLREGKQTRI
jgi:hypothetical protein